MSMGVNLIVEFNLNISIYHNITEIKLKVVSFAEEKENIKTTNERNVNEK